MSTTQLTPHTKQKLKEVAPYMGLSENEIIDLAVSSYIAMDDAKAEAQLRDEMGWWRQLKFESIRRAERRLIKS
jgi:hypothetical protein